MNVCMQWRTGTFGLGEAVTLLPPPPKKKIHNLLYKRTQIAVKTKTLPILKSNERVIIPKSQLNPNFSNFRGKRTLVQNIRYFEKSGVTKITVFD